MGHVSERARVITLASRRALRDRDSLLLPLSPATQHLCLRSQTRLSPAAAKENTKVIRTLRGSDILDRMLGQVVDLALVLASEAHLGDSLLTDLGGNGHSYSRKVFCHSTSMNDLSDTYF